MEDLADRLSSWELTRWAAFERVFGPLTVQERVDLAGAIVASTVARAAGAKVKVEEFLPDWGDERRLGGPDSVVAGFEALMAMAEARDRADDRDADRRR